MVIYRNVRKVTPSFNPFKVLLRDTWRTLRFGPERSAGPPDLESIFTQRHSAVPRSGSTAVNKVLDSIFKFSGEKP